MAIDTSIYGQIQPTQPVQNPLAQLGQLAQIQHYQAQAGKSQRDEERQNKLYGLVASPEFAKMDAQGKAGALQGVGAFDEAGKVVTSNAAANKDTRAAEQTQLEMAIKRNDALSGAMQRLSQNPNEAPMVLRQMVDSQIIAPDYAQKIMQGAQGAPDPAQFFAAGAQAAVSAKDQLAQQIQKEGQAIQVRGQNMTAQTAIRGQDMTDTRMRDKNQIDAAATGVKAQGQNRDAEMKLSDDYRAQSKDFKAVADAYRTIDATLDKATTSPAATLAGATKFMKLLDPGSVVRESELGMALAASGVIDRATNYVNVLQNGKVLTPTQVADFKNITKQIYDAAKQGQSAVDTDYVQKAEAYGLNPKNIVQDLGPKDKPKPAAGGAVNRKTINGVTYENDGKGWYKAD